MGTMLMLKTRWTKFFLFLLTTHPTISLSTTLTSNEVTINVAERWGPGVTREGLEDALDEARALFLLDPTTKVHIFLEEGTHTLSFMQPGDSIDLSGPGPSHGGRLIIEGASFNRTTLLYPPENMLLAGRDINPLTIRNIHLRRSRPTTSQGIVEGTGVGWVEVRVEDGYPSIEDIHDNSTDQPTKGRYLRRYTMKEGVCQIVEDNNDQVAWSTFTWLGGRSWRLHLHPPSTRLDYSIGDLVGIKSKCCGEGRSAYWICGGNDIVFESITWSRQSRGVIRCGASNLRFSNITIRRDHEGDCLSPSGGGPQLGQPHDQPIHNVTVENLRAENTGDDSIAFFNVASGGVVRNSNISDSFARGILLYNSPTTVLEGNEVERCPVLFMEPSDFALTWDDDDYQEPLISIFK